MVDQVLYPPDAGLFQDAGVAVLACHRVHFTHVHTFDVEWRAVSDGVQLFHPECARRWGWVFHLVPLALSCLHEETIQQVGGSDGPSKSCERSARLLLD